MKTDTTTYLALMAKGAAQYQVPLFQRRFAWTREEHLGRLWSDIVARLEAPQGSGSEDHFCGSLVLDPGRFTIEGVTSVLVIQGQQFLISLQLPLAALREVAKDVGLRIPGTGGETKEPDGHEGYRTVPSSVGLKRGVWPATHVDD